tara:strand:- start:207 stop:374 length:168 start_codon:yes stop_codon:yes gene_type:complete
MPLLLIVLVDANAQLGYSHIGSFHESYQGLFPYVRTIVSQFISYYLARFIMVIAQ